MVNAPPEKRSETHTSHLLELPDEILISVFSFLDYDDLRETCFVCRRFHGFSEPRLYETIQIRDGTQALALGPTLLAKPERPQWVRDLLVSTKFGHENDLSVLPPCIARMRNLRTLRLETPDLNQKPPEDRIGWTDLQNRYERIFEHSSLLITNRSGRYLPDLEECTLHFVDSTKELYPLPQYSTLFLHPTLKSLTLSCANTDHPKRLLANFQKDQSLLKSTALEYLHLEECDIYAPSLAVLLSFPQCLKALKISEGIRYDRFNHHRSSRMHGNMPPDRLADALEKDCVESLEWLSLSLGYRRHVSHEINDYGQHLNLTAFLNLKHLELSGNTVLLIRRLPCDHQTWRRLPPNLESLKIFSMPLIRSARELVFFAGLQGQSLDAPKLPFDECFLRAKGKHGAAKLTELTYAYEYFEPSGEMFVDDNDRLDTERAIDGAKAHLRAEGVRMQESCRRSDIHLQIELTVLPAGYIPPYLATEALPVSTILWQSSVR